MKKTNIAHKDKLPHPENTFNSMTNTTTARRYARLTHNKIAIFRNSLRLKNEVLAGINLDIRIAKEKIEQSIIHEKQRRFQILEGYLDAIRLTEIAEQKGEKARFEVRQTLDFLLNNLTFQLKKWGKVESKQYDNLTVFELINIAKLKDEKINYLTQQLRGLERIFEALTKLDDRVPK
jgi:hypothetical protein